MRPSEGLPLRSSGVECYFSFRPTTNVPIQESDHDLATITLLMKKATEFAGQRHVHHYGGKVCFGVIFFEPIHRHHVGDA